MSILRLRMSRRLTRNTANNEEIEQVRAELDEIDERLDELRDFSDVSDSEFDPEGLQVDDSRQSADVANMDEPNSSSSINDNVRSEAPDNDQAVDEFERNLAEANNADDDVDVPDIAPFDPNRFVNIIHSTRPFRIPY